MKSITNTSVINLRPTIIVSHECLQAIKHIVSIAPQEAQWFHTVEAVEYKQSPGEVLLHLSDRLYIPKQNTSAAQVDSSSSMMIEFYNELKEEYQDQNIINEKLNSMTCWCHSHHNMNPSPSGQDNNQFNFFVNSSQEQKQNNWQIMLIFNKKDQFYSRVYDPVTGVIIEGVDIVVSNDSYDFSYINKAAKEKFLKPPVKKFNFKSKATSFSTKSKPQSSGFDISWSDYFSNKESIFQKEINSTIAEEVIEDVYSVHYSDEELKTSVSVLPKNSNSDEICNQISKLLDDQELVLFSFVLENNYNKLKNFWSDAQCESYMLRYSHVVKNKLLKYFSSTKDTLDQLKEKLTFVYSLTDAPSREDFYTLINKSL
jgi:hypothetical protein